MHDPFGNHVLAVINITVQSLGEDTSKREISGYDYWFCVYRVSACLRGRYAWRFHS